LSQADTYALGAAAWSAKMEKKLAKKNDFGRR